MDEVATTTFVVGLLGPQGELVPYKKPYRVTVLGDTLRDPVTGMVVGVRLGTHWVSALLPTIVLAVEQRQTPPNTACS